MRQESLGKGLAEGGWNAGGEWRGWGSTDAFPKERTGGLSERASLSERARPEGQLGIPNNG